MEITLLGQAGVHVALENGLSIMVDPYLTDTLYETEGQRFLRLVPRNPEWGNRRPDVLAVTHEHADHMDMPLLRQWLNAGAAIQLLVSPAVYEALSIFRPSGHNMIVARPGVEATLFDAKFTVVPAYHEMPDAVGFLIEAEDKVIYFTGDTLYSARIPESIGERRIDVMLPCINGFGNNMNYADAARLVNILRPKVAVPVHWDMFEAYGEDPRRFAHEVSPDIDVRILQAYCTIVI